MYTVCIRRSSRSGNPELWGYELTSSTCNIVYGSLVTGGLTSATKEIGYGRKTEAVKVREGYTRVNSQVSRTDIDAAKAAVKGSKNLMSSEAFSIYAAAMTLLGKTPLASLLVTSPKSTAPAASTPDPVTAAAIAPPAKFFVVTKSDKNRAWVW